VVLLTLAIVVRAGVGMPVTSMRTGQSKEYLDPSPAEPPY